MHLVKLNPLEIFQTNTVETICSRESLFFCRLVVTNWFVFARILEFLSHKFKPLSVLFLELYIFFEMGQLPGIWLYVYDSVGGLCAFSGRFSGSGRNDLKDNL